MPLWTTNTPDKGNRWRSKLDGSNSYGALAKGTTATESGAADVDYLTDVTQVAAGDHDTLAIYTRAVISDPRRHGMSVE